MPVQLPSNQIQIRHKELLAYENKELWIHEHTTMIKALEVAGVIIGIGMICCVPLASSYVIALALSGSALTLASGTAFFATDYFLPVHHDMKDHVFKPGECEGGKLYYEGDVPILSLNANDPYKAGHAHGYLCGDAINRVVKRFDMVLHTLGGMPRAHQVPKTIASLRATLPEHYLKELEGLYAGYTQWAKENWWQFPQKISLDDFLLNQLIPDIHHFNHGHAERLTPAQMQSAVACTALVDKDSFARNMDFASFGTAGKHSLIINRRYTNGLHNTAEVAVAGGLLGTLTGMNDQGLSVAMNICAGNTKEVRGMPAILYIRDLLERCKNVTDVETYVNNHSPLGPFNLTVADPNKAKSFHFYQSAYGSHATRECPQNKPLTTLNFRYSPDPHTSSCYSYEREDVLDQFLRKRSDRPLDEALSLPFVNNSGTLHSVLMNPKTRTLSVGFDNAFAGKVKKRPVHTQTLFCKV